MAGLRRWKIKWLTSFALYFTIGYLLLVQDKREVVRYCPQQMEDAEPKYGTQTQGMTTPTLKSSTSLVSQHSPLEGPFSDVDIDLKGAKWIEEMRKGNETGFLKLKDSDVFLVSAFVSNSTRNTRTPWDKFVINGWEHKDCVNKTYTCCFLFRDLDIQFNTMINKLNYYIRAALNANQFVCDRSNISAEYINGMTIVPAGRMCPDSPDDYLKLKYLHRPTKKSVAISGKVVHGNKNPRELVEWFEVQKLFGVEKILMYPLSNLNDVSVKVLRYYEQAGLVEIVPFYNVPEKKKYKREFSSLNNAVKFNDLQVMVFDGEERLKEYRYAILMDTDEFIIPTNSEIKSYTQMMDVLLRSRLNNAGFMFWDQLYIKTWGKINNSSELYIGQYQNRTEEIMDRPKLIFIPERVQQGSLQIHGLNGAKGYKGTNYVPKHVAVLKHYRNCREDWKIEKCMKNFTRITDTSMLPLADAILPNVRHVRQKLGF